MEVELKKRDDESKTQYIYRLASAKDSGELDMTWDELAEVFNEQLGCHYGSSAYRKPYTQAMEYFNEVFSNMYDDAAVRELRQAKYELYKERTRLRDERNQMNKQLREEARKEAFMDEMRNVLVEQYPIANVEEPEDRPPKKDVFGHVKCEEHPNQAIVCLSDLHVGVETANTANRYDQKTIGNRLRCYEREIRKIQERHNIDTCYLCLLGDLISGSIHASITATNSLDTVRQIKVACSEIGEFVRSLSYIFKRIRIFSVSGNHSRVNANKNDNIHGDNLDDLIIFYLNAALKDNKRVTVYDGNECYYSHRRNDSTYGYSRFFRTDGDRYVAMVHGDLDTPDRVVQNMTQLYDYVPDIILMGHMHHSAYNTIGKTRIIQNGCLSGTDDYSYNKRLFAPPEQTVIVTSSRKPVECIYNVSLEDEETHPPEANYLKPVAQRNMDYDE